MAAMKNEVNVPLTITIGVVGILLLVVATVAVDGWYKSVEAEEISQKWDQSPNTWLQNMRNVQHAEMADGHQINRYHYKLDIDDAMKLVAARQGKMSE